MYSIYLNPTTSYNSMSLNDYIQLQNVYAREQQRLERQRQIEQEELLLQSTIRQLKALREIRIQREREERAIQAYYQQLARLRQEEQIRQERERQIYQNYISALQNQMSPCQPATKSSMFYHPNDVLATCSTAAHDEYISDSDSEEEEEEHFPQIINVIFNGATQEKGESSKGQTYGSEEAKKETTAAIQDELPSATTKQYTATIDAPQQSNEMNVNQFMDYFNEKLQKFNEEYENSKNELQENQDTSEEHEPNLVPLLQDEDQNMEEAENPTSATTQHIENIEEVPVSVNVPATEERNPISHEYTNFEQQSENLTSLVNELSVQSDSPFSEEDPVRLAKYDALNRIEEELVEIQLKNANILQNSLDFDTDSQDLPANTANNREFLGYEDQLVKIMLKLDMIESDGDEDIRAERKSLVKRAESLLEALDDFKHREWERVSNSSHSGSDDEYIMA